MERRRWRGGDGEAEMERRRWRGGDGEAEMESCRNYRPETSPRVPTSRQDKSGTRSSIIRM